MGEDFIQRDAVPTKGGFEVRRCADGGHPAQVHNRHPMAEVFGFFHIVRRQEDGRAVFNP
jgi:hypothetical protein